MRDDIPSTHVAQAFELSPDAYVDLYKIQLNAIGAGLSIYLASKKDVTWQGMTFEGLPISMTQEGVNANGQWNRPKLTVANPDGVFSAYIMQGKLDNASVTRYRVLLTDVTSDNGVFQLNMWRISKPLNVSIQMATFELRSPLDGQSFFLPGRAYYPPEFSHVSL